MSFMVGMVGIAAVVLFVINDVRQNQSGVIEGEERSVAQVLGNPDTYFVSEPNFEFELPADWREIDRSDTSQEQSITWQATLRNEDNRYLKLYMNTIPDDPVVRLLPVRVNGNALQRGQLSAVCGTFTGESLPAAERRGLPPTMAKWEDVDFLCNLASIVDTNVIGTGEVGRPLNTFRVSGDKSGENDYFFVYTDRNVRPNFEIFYNVITSFRAK